MFLSLTYATNPFFQGDTEPTWSVAVAVGKPKFQDMENLPTT